jgi:hypothetical protein
MPIALYYKAFLREYSPDIAVLGQKETLHFYSDYPHGRSRRIWYRLYREFSNSPESLEARWRIAKHWAGQGRFERADKLLTEAQTIAAERLKLLEKEQKQGETILGSFRPPADSVMTAFKLAELQRRLNELRHLISPENRTDKPGTEERLAKFAMLNPHNRDYARDIEALLEQMGDKDRLRDNVLLAQAKLVADEQLRAEKLSGLHKKYQKSDGGMQALYELGLLKRRQWSQQDESNLELKKKLLTETRTILTSFISLYPDSFCTEQVKKNLADLPTVD